MTRRAFAVAALSALGILAGVAALLWAFLVVREGPEPETVPEAIVRGDAPVRDPTLRLPEPPKGGSYGGIVVDTRGAPVANAGIVLVAVEADALQSFREAADEPAVIGPRVAAVGSADASGRFRVAADAASAVRHVIAHRLGFMPQGLDVEGPSDDLRIVLQDAGQFVGTVVDAETGAAVAGVDVSILLQAKEEHVAPPALVTVQNLTAEVLGPYVWGIPYAGDSAFHVRTDQDGTFRFAPIGSEVQMEFVLTHPEYLWSEHDLVDGVVRRTVVQPGSTVERTFRLQKGKWISGKVVDDQMKGVPDVRVEVRHVVARYQHWYYRDRKRVATTGADGSFRVAGLSHGPYVVTLVHPSFGAETIGQVPENTAGLQWGVHSFGALAGTVEGLDERKLGFLVDVVLEPVEESASTRSETKVLPLDAKGAFHWRKILPGRYRVWVRAGNRASLPEEIEIRKNDESSFRFVLGGGGSIEVDVVDAQGRPIDPVTVTLLQTLPAGERALGKFVGRAGRVFSDGIRPGKYRMVAQADGYLPRSSPPFEVAEEGSARLEPIRLSRQGFLKIGRIEGPRAPSSVELFVREGDAAERRVLLRDENLLGVAVAPGPVTVRAKSPEGWTFEQTVEVPDGGTETVDVVLR